MTTQEVSPLVNSVRNDQPACIAAYEAPPAEPDRQLDLFASKR
jgi:hypothetical protein